MVNEGSRWARASPTTSRAADATSLPREATEAANRMTWEARRDAAATTRLVHRLFDAAHLAAAAACVVGACVAMVTVVNPRK